MSEVAAPGAGQAPRAAGPIAHTVEDDRYFIASQWQLMWRKFTRHKLAIAGGAVLAVFYVFAIFSEFFATHDILKHSSEFVFMRPQKIRFGDENGWGLRPFVYDVQKVVDRKAFRRVYVERPRDAPLHPLLRARRPLQAVGHLGGGPAPGSGSRRGRSTCSAPTSSAATCTRAPCTRRAFRCRSAWWECS